jgi:NADH-quinone oxidoreductase subunit D
MTQTRNMLLNVGPSHPAMHGVIRMIMELDGEKIKDVDIEIGYLHRAFEKMCETVMYTQCFPYTDRLNYVSPLINNVGFALAVEKLLGIETPERSKYIRVIMSEISRVTDHLTCVGASAMELGAMSVFLYMIKAREFLWELVEEITGARLTISYVRIGGVKADLTPGFADKAFEKIAEVRKVLIEADELLTRNRIFFDRMKNIGKITQEDAIAYGVTGPFLRATGVAYDVRKSNPYLIYDKLDFEVPVGTTGDNLDRYFVRMEEMEQSLRIIEQCFQQIPDGPIAADLTGVVIPAAEMVDQAKMGQTADLIEDEVSLDPTLQGSTRKYYNSINANKKDVVLPAKENTYGNIEGLMNHFKLVMYGHGIKPPVGEVYLPVEGANGELGFYIVSDGRDHPWRVRVHPPCFPIMAALPKCLIGDMMADLVPTFGSVNMIAGELDR